MPENFVSVGEAAVSVLLRPSTDWPRPTHNFGRTIYLSAISKLNCNFIYLSPSKKKQRQQQQQQQQKNPATLDIGTQPVGMDDLHYHQLDI